VNITTRKALAAGDFDPRKIFAVVTSSARA